MNVFKINKFYKMGCGFVNNDEKNIIGLKLGPFDAAIDCSFDKKNIENSKISENFDKYCEVLRQFESFRKCIIDKRDVIFYKSGACCSQEFNFKLVIKTIVATVSMLHNGGMWEYIDFFKTDNTAKLPELLDNVNIDIMNYKAELEKIKKDYEDIKIKINSYSEEMRDHYEDIINLINKEKDSDNLKQFFEKIKSIFNKIIEDNMLYELEKIYTDDLEFFKDMTSKLIDFDYLEKINDLGQQAVKKRYTNQYQINYYLILQTYQKNGLSPDVGKNEFKRKIEYKQRNSKK